MVTVSGASPRAGTVLDCLLFVSLGRFSRQEKTSLANQEIEIDRPYFGYTGLILVIKEF